MKILITGGFGFIGGRVSQYLANQAHDVIIATRSPSSLFNLPAFAKVININLDKLDTLTDACKNIDLVIHAAGINSQECLENPIAAHRFNAIGTKNLLNASIKNGVKRFIYLSTAHVYSARLDGIIDEFTPTLNPHP